jgi:hypothetical protein
MVGLTAGARLDCLERPQGDTQDKEHALRSARTRLGQIITALASVEPVGLTLEATAAEVDHTTHKLVRALQSLLPPDATLEGVLVLHLERGGTLDDRLKHYCVLAALELSRVSVECSLWVAGAVSLLTL